MLGSKDGLLLRWVVEFSKGFGLSKWDDLASGVVMAEGCRVKAIILPC
jgi:hypothetical protein